jgi:hypothetical protein
MEHLRRPPNPLQEKPLQVSIEHCTQTPRLPPSPRVHAGALAVGFLQHRIDDLRLLTSEVVTNSRDTPTGAGDTIGLAVDLSERRIRVSIVDDGPGSIRRNFLSPPRGSWGWGLWLGKQLSDRWGAIGMNRTAWFGDELVAAIDPLRYYILEPHYKEMSPQTVGARRWSSAWTRNLRPTIAADSILSPECTTDRMYKLA